MLGVGLEHVTRQSLPGSCGTTPSRTRCLRDLLPTITTPTQIVAGRDDELVPWSNNQYLDDLLPNSEIHPLDAGHFAWEQAAAKYGRLVVDWVSGGYRGVGNTYTAEKSYSS
jgi:pimeloyl-ACP methyl ester carboxylesterase